jgi:hypothetical protein
MLGRAEGVPNQRKRRCFATALVCLEELVSTGLLSLAPQTGGRLPPNVGRLHDTDYFELCSVVLSWYKNAGSLISDESGVPDEEVTRTTHAAIRRRAQLADVLEGVR